MSRSERFYTRRLTSRQFYRNERGKFISKAEGIRRGIVPSTSRFYIYQDQTGKRRSERFVQRQRQRIITITQSGELLRRESPEVIEQVSQVIPEPSFQTIMSQRFRTILNDAVSRGKTIGVQFNDQMYVLDQTQVGDLERFFTEVEYEYIRLFEPITGGVYLQMLHAEGMTGEVFDFDSMTTSPTDLDDEELNQANEEFRQSMQQSWRRYFS